MQNRFQHRIQSMQGPTRAQTRKTSPRSKIKDERSPDDASVTVVKQDQALPAACLRLMRWRCSAITKRTTHTEFVRALRRPRRSLTANFRGRQ
jgi:hypothetical protein